MTKANWFKLRAQVGSSAINQGSRVGKKSRIARKANFLDLDRASIIIIAATLLCILAITLFPYEFFFAETIADFTWAGLRERAYRPILMPMEFLANILMFVPLGFGFALRLRKRKVAAALTTILLSLIVTISIEFLQIFLPSRTPSHIDIISNTMGGALGFAIWRYWQPLTQNRWVHQLENAGSMAYQTLVRPLLPYWQLIKPKPRAQRQMIAIALCLYGCLSLWGTHALRTSDLWSLSNWDPTYPLLLGNELKGDRPWNGQISNVQIYNQQLEPADIQQLLSHPERSPAKATPLAHYPLSGRSPYTDLTHHLPDLIWRGNAPTPSLSPTAAAVSFSPQRWLETQSPPSELIEQIKAAEAFTISLTAKTNSREQTGPARILSLSQGPFNRNLTIGQKGSSLSLRLRTPITKENGLRPEFSVPSVFAAPQPHHLILTYNAHQIAFYIDTLASEQKFQFSPETILFWKLAPPVLSTIQINSATLLICQLLYRILWFLPVGIILLYTTKFSYKNKLNNRQFQIAIVAIAATFYGLLEAFLR